MFGMSLLRGTALAVALSAAGLVGTSASAGGCDYDRGYNNNRNHHDHVTVRHHGNHDHVTVRHHTTTRHRDHYHNQVRTTRHTTYRNGGHYNNGNRDRGYVSQPSGYYRNVWVPAVYRTYYDDCGYPYRSKVRNGYYRQVWVNNSCDY